MFHTTLLGAILVGLVAFVVGLGLYTVSLIDQYAVEAFSLARSTAMVVDSVADGMKAFALRFILAIALVQIVYAVLITLRMKKTVVKPINEIAEAAQAYVADKRAGVNRNDHFEMLNLTADDVLRKTNQALCSNNQMDMFVTCWLGMLEISTGKLVAVSAGHEYPAIKGPAA